MAAMVNWEDFYGQCWDILVEHAGARPSDRDCFILNCLDDEHPLTEYRFCGLLGFGGKFWRCDGMVYVNCYPEDDNQKRTLIIDKTNKALAAITPAEGVHGSPKAHARIIKYRERP